MSARAETTATATEDAPRTTGRAADDCIRRCEGTGNPLLLLYASLTVCLYLLVTWMTKGALLDGRRVAGALILGAIGVSQFFFCACVCDSPSRRPNRKRLDGDHFCDTVAAFGCVVLTLGFACALLVR